MQYTAYPMRQGKWKFSDENRLNIVTGSPEEGTSLLPKSKSYEGECTFDSEFLRFLQVLGPVHFDPPADKSSGWVTQIFQYRRKHYRPAAFETSSKKSTQDVCVTFECDSLYNSFLTKISKKTVIYEIRFF